MGPWMLGYDAWPMQVGHGPWHGGPHVKLGCLLCLFNIVNSHWNNLARRVGWSRFWFDDTQSLGCFSSTNWSVEILMARYPSPMAKFHLLITSIKPVPVPVPLPPAHTSTGWKWWMNIVCRCLYNTFLFLYNSISYGIRHNNLWSVP